MQLNKKYLRWINILLLGLIASGSAYAECVQVGRGETFLVKEGLSSCLNVSGGHKIVHCVVTGLMQNSYLLVTPTSVEANSLYRVPQTAILIHYNQQRLVFTGFGSRDEAELVFHYFGPWDPSYQFNLTCTW